MILLTDDDVAARLLVSPKTVSRLRAGGHLRGTRIGRQWRYHPDDVEDYLTRAKSPMRST